MSAVHFQFTQPDDMSEIFDLIALLCTFIDLNCETNFGERGENIIDVTDMVFD